MRSFVKILVGLLIVVLLVSTANAYTREQAENMRDLAAAYMVDNDTIYEPEVEAAIQDAEDAGCSAEGARAHGPEGCQQCENCDGCDLFVEAETFEMDCGGFMTDAATEQALYDYNIAEGNDYLNGTNGKSQNFDLAYERYEWAKDNALDKKQDLIGDRSGWPCALFSANDAERYYNYAYDFWMGE